MSGPSKLLRSEGDLNISPNRRAWAERNLDPETSRWLDEDARYFLHQSLSTPCLDVLKGCDGAAITTMAGREMLDFHGNNVHQIGFSHPKIVAAITAQMQELSFCTRRYTNIPAIQLARKLTELAPGDLNRVSLVRDRIKDGLIFQPRGPTQKISRSQEI